ncbi:MAG: ASPIC/UnbV domain-containing protein, partial [Verrucomicrobiota bacterium]
DVFLSQNFFAVQIETPRNDGGRGLWLRGDGKGNLVAVPGQESGIKVYGEQRGSALCDFDADGRVDVVVSQNGAETKLYRNVGGKPGIRVRLAGGAENPGGIGAVLRLEYADGKKGPVRAILAGSGYWSQDSAVAVLGKAGEPESLWVRWPGGKETRVKIPAGAKEIKVGVHGMIASL